MKGYSTAIKFLSTCWKKNICFFLLFFCIHNGMKAQCPANLDFETGTFAGWKLYTGKVAEDEATNQNIITLTEVPAPVAGRHEMLSADPGDGLDEYGGFPKNCPNGSQHSIKLGNNTGGNDAEGASYEFTIPATANEFSLIYYYAVVIQDPGHPISQQPRFEIQVTDVTDNTAIGCSSFDFIVSGGLPGFNLSAVPGSNSPVWYKTWSANSINLDGNAGKTIRVFFKTADCTFVSHFGYAYIDVSTQCSSSFVGAAFCQADTAVNISAPFGYLNYTWYNSNFSQVLGTGPTLHISPPPPNGTNVYVKLTPYSGYGCVDTLKASLVDTLHVVANAGPDATSCNGKPVQLGEPSNPDLVYKWTPAAGLNNANISNPTALVTTPTKYVLTVTTVSGSCLTTDTVLVNADALDNSIQLTGSDAYCSASGQSAVLKVSAADNIQWYKGNDPINGATQPQYNVTGTGVYKALMSNNGGCSLSTDEKTITIYQSPAADFSIPNTSQCLVGNQFVFTNNSTTSGTAEYTWDLGDGNMLNTPDINYTYNKSGSFTAKLTVKTAGDCIDNKTIPITVIPSAIADFALSPAVCVNLDLPVINKTTYTGTSTINYLWDFGNGQQATDRVPVYNYTIPGTYNIKLTTSTTQCPQPSVKHAVLVIDEPAAAITYPDQTAIFNYPLQLEARPIGTSVLWSPATNLNSPTSFKPIFRGTTEQLYNIKITTVSGCETNDKQLVKTIKKIEIHVPTIFTPNGDGNNDYLRPLLYGFKKVNYFKVYSRWGKLLFQMESDLPGWDGKINNIVQDLQTVVWVIEAVDVDNNVHHAQGSTILMR